MSQHDMSIANQGFPAFRADLNDALPALASNNSGATEPSTMFAHQWWVDTSANPSVLKQRNADNDAWITVGSFDQAADTFTLTGGSAGAFTTLSASGTSTLDAVTATTVTASGVLTVSANTVTNINHSIYSATQWHAPRYNTIRGRGTVASPSGVLTGDEIWSVQNSAINTNLGTNYSGGIFLYATGTVSGNNVPTYMAFDVASAVSAVEGMRLSSTGLAVTGAISATEIISANKGIAFPATQVASADANTLDDYEEGTWTPLSNTAGYTTSVAVGVYTKVGRQVSIIGSVRFSAISGATSLLNLTGLPFTSAVIDATLHYTGVCRENTTAGDIFVVQQQHGTTNLGINSMDGVTAGSNQIFAITRDYSFSFTYFV